MGCCCKKRQVKVNDENTLYPDLESNEKGIEAKSETQLTFYSYIMNGRIYSYKNKIKIYSLSV